MSGDTGNVGTGNVVTGSTGTTSQTNNDQSPATNSPLGQDPEIPSAQSQPYPQSVDPGTLTEDKKAQDLARLLSQKGQRFTSNNPSKQTETGTPVHVTQLENPFRDTTGAA